MTAGNLEFLPHPPRVTGPWEHAKATDAPGRRAMVKAAAWGEPRPHNQVFNLEKEKTNQTKHDVSVAALLNRRVAFSLLQGASSPLLASPCRTGQTWDRHAIPATPASSVTTPWRSVGMFFFCYCFFLAFLFFFFSPFLLIFSNKQTYSNFIFFLVLRI